MAESITLARPYAKAAFETARGADQLTQWSEQLSFISAIVENEDTLALLNHPTLTSEQKSQVILDVSDGKLDGAVENLIKVLSANHRLTLLPEITSLFEQLKSQQEATVKVTVETAFELNSEQEEKLTQSLKAKLDCEVSLQTELNKDLIGGVLIRAGDLVIDASVRGRLAKLVESIGS